jgi:hypothetical protein
MERWSMGKSNLAAWRGAKANRRKAIVAQKRKAGAMGGTLAGQVARAASAPIRCCLLTERLLEHGMGTLLLARGSGAGQLVVGAFLLDTFCLGIKDVVLQPMEPAQLEGYLDTMNTATLMVPIDPGYGRKLLRELSQWSASLGFMPHADFAVAERLFGDVEVPTFEANFQFGRGGKVVYMPGPSESPLLVRRRIEQLTERLEPGGFDYIDPAEEAAE